MYCYRVRLLDISSNGPRALTRSFVVCTDSIQKAANVSLKRLKRYKIYTEDERVRNYVQTLEIWNKHEKIGNSIDCAGHEFDVLPEVLREILLEITLIERAEKEDI